MVFNAHAYPEISDQRISVCIKKIEENVIFGNTYHKPLHHSTPADMFHLSTSKAIAICA